ncbi:MAG: FtsX-like permease family protein [Bacteroidota bacterium]
MNISLFIARRYLFSKKSQNAINIITWVAITGIMVGTAALVLVMSVFNGLAGFIEDLYSSFDPDLKVVATRGVTFEENEKLWEAIENHPEVAAITKTIEGQIILSYVENRTFGLLKGVESSFTEINPIDDFIYFGEFTFKTAYDRDGIIPGDMVFRRLHGNWEDEQRPIWLSYIPPDAPTNPIQLAAAVQTTAVFPTGIFGVQKEYDEKYVLADFDFARRFLEREGEVSAYEIKLKDLTKAADVKADLMPLLPEDTELLTWYEQHKTLYRVMKNEKYITFLIIILMVAMLAINIVGSLSMIILEKTRDIAVVKSMGADDGIIRRVFMLEGLLVGGIGVSIGMALAFIVGYFQEKSGFFMLSGGESFVALPFPLDMQWQDFVVIFISVLSLSILASWYPATKAGSIQVREGLTQ